MDGWMDREMDGWIEREPLVPVPLEVVRLVDGQLEGRERER